MSRISLYTQQINLTLWHDKEIGEELMLSPFLLGLHGNTAGFSLTHHQQTESRRHRRTTYLHKREHPQGCCTCVHTRDIRCHKQRNWKEHSYCSRTGQATTRLLCDHLLVFLPLDCADPAPTTDTLAGSTPDLPTLFPKASLSIA